MNLNSATYSAPGSIMLMGEHAVVYGYDALAAAIDKRIHVHITLRDDNEISIESNTLGSYQTSIGNLKITKPFEFVLAAIMQSDINQGCDIKIHSEFSHVVGLGSSAAVTVATVSALNHLCSPTQKSLYETFSESLNVIRSIQKVGSGADVAASTFGGIVEYNCHETPQINKLINSPDISLLYCGYKKPTIEVVELVKLQHQEKPDQVTAIFEKIHSLTQQASEGILQQDWKKFGELCSQQQSLMTKLNLSDATLDQLIKILETAPGITGAKISGSGLGDCVVGIGSNKTMTLPSALKDAEQIHTNISLQGVINE